MRLATLRLPDGTRAARIEGDVQNGFDGASGILLDAADVGALLASPDYESLAVADGQAVALAHTMFAPVVTAPEKVVCVGLNYALHIKETNGQTPAAPTYFTKFASSLAGAYDDIPLPAESDKVDWEAELTVVIGRAGRRIPVGDALSHVAGYTVMNDVSMRDWQRRTTQFLAGKAWDASSPVGPWMVTADALPTGASGLRISTEVDGETLQDSRTDDMLFDVAALISDLSTFVTLRPGDIVATGTPSGVGAGMQPPRFVRAGEVVKVAVESIGALENRFVAEA